MMWDSFWGSMVGDLYRRVVAIGLLDISGMFRQCSSESVIRRQEI